MPILAGLVVPLAPGLSSGTSAAAIAQQDCSFDPGVSVLWAWSGGVIPSIHLPASDWRLSSHPTNPFLSFMVPGDWSTAVLDLPPWLAGTWEAFDWAGVRVTSADATSAVEVGSAPIQGIFDASTATSIGIDSIFGGREPRILCSEYFPAVGSSVVVAELDGTLAYVAGYAFPDQATGHTAFVYYAAAAPAATFAVVTENVFITVFYQFYRNGGGDEDDGGGGGGDDDGDDDGDGDGGPPDTIG